ncbi:hypothetical protein BJ508DRAFT_411803 [Ascobolus immersus RN42]|uniref:DUF4219 domain-containing protein n=1 Tax=Ascobolus immersus RN42 TaxID=1160509 RepID=A0A3N4II78_ASCIM|nr:hypothetical protein BJ508DRAFT_411803 [Ascobolus immersus RN42]
MDNSACWAHLVSVLPKLAISKYHDPKMAFGVANVCINYSAWKFRLKQFLEYEGLWDVVDPSAKASDLKDKDDMSFIAKDRRAFLVLTLTLSDPISRLVCECRSAREAWQAIEKEYGDGKRKIKDISEMALNSYADVSGR